MLSLINLIISFFLITTINTLVKDGVYNLITDNNLYLQYNYNKNKIQISDSHKYEAKSNFRIKISSDSYYKIEHIVNNFALTTKNNDLQLKIYKDNEPYEWIFIEEKKGLYIVQNKNKCYLTYKRDNLKCEKVEKKEAIRFSLDMIFVEVNHSKEDLELIEKEPIDVVIKYIDLRDNDLHREGIPQIKKDEDNEELKYSVRSILKYIPWVNKIVIIMPNKKVRYFKEYDFIKEKIIYINDKELIGFDSANIYTFHFNFWRLLKYNVSRSIISMDDDYFIGGPLKKSDFFHVENGKIVPSIVALYYRECDRNIIEMEKNYYKKQTLNLKIKQGSEEFLYTVFNTYSFLYKIFEKNLRIPDFTHNAIPCNLEEIKETYDIVYKSKYKESTLDSIYRGIETLQFQTFYQVYIFMKYSRKVNLIPHIYSSIAEVLNTNYNVSLFVINTGGIEYSKLTFLKAKSIMEKLFPEPTKYEIYNYSLLPNFCFDIISEMEKINNENEHRIKLLNISNIICFIESAIILIIIVFFFNNRKNSENKKTYTLLNNKKNENAMLEIS